MRVHLVAALARNRVIGRGGKMPWHLSADLKRFKTLTMGRPILMGRKTWEAIGRPLPGRESVVVTRQAGYEAPGAVVVPSLDAALAHAKRAGAKDAFVIGGGEIYRLALPLADVLHLTLIDRDYEGDATFPAWDASAWRETSREPHEEDGLAYAFVTLERQPRHA